jgi:para-nitrobenzyl esterase
VTVFGESAGGRNTFSLLVSPLAEGLFHRAIVQSGGTRHATLAEAENPVDAAEPGHRASSAEIVKRLLVREGRPDAGPEEVAALLRGLEPEALFSLYVEDSREPGLGMIEMPQVFVEETVLPRTEHAAFASGAYNRVPVVTGTNRDENKLFLSRDERFVTRRFGVIPVLEDPERYEVVAGYMSRAWKASAVDELAPLLRASQGPSVYAYRFDWDEEPVVFGSDLSVVIGAAHVLEVPFVFGHFDLGRAGQALFDEENEPGRLELSGAMMSYWAEFAYRGDPGRGREGALPLWSAWDASGPQADKYIVLDTSADGGLRMASETESAEKLVAEIQSDPRFTSEAQRCEMLTALAGWYDRVEALVEEEGAVQLACAPTGGEAVGGE